MLEYINQLDHDATIYLNGIHNPLWDRIMLFITNKYTWFPAYAALIAFFIIVFKKRGALMTVAFILSVLFIEISSSWISKPYFERYRPCKDPVVSTQIRSIDGCRSLYGFFSGHSSQSFGIAVLLILFFRRRNWWFWVSLLWAGLVAYSRVYLGVHYLGDILFGAIFGTMSAFLFYWLFKKADKKLFPTTYSSAS